MAAKAATVSSAINASRHGAVSFSSETIARVREVLQTVDEDLLSMEAPQPVDPYDQTPDGILRTYETLLAHGFEVDDIENALQVRCDPSQPRVSLSAGPCCTVAWANVCPPMLSSAGPSAMQLEAWCRRPHAVAGACRRTTPSTGCVSTWSSRSCRSSLRPGRRARPATV